MTYLFIHFHIFFEKKHTRQSRLYMNIFKPKCVKSITIIIGVNLLRLGGLHICLHLISNTSLITQFVNL